MAMIQGLPTEILCAIFEQSIPNLPTFISESTLVPCATNPPSLTPPAWQVSKGSSPTKSTRFSACPPLRDVFGHSMALSQVCIRWREIAIGLQSLWTRMRLGHNAFVSLDHTDEKTAEMTTKFLSRSGQLPLFLDISFTIDDPLNLIASSYVQKARYEKNIQRSLLPHVERCLSLRLVSNYIINSAVLDVFLDINLSSPAKYSALSHLHLEQTFSTSHAGCLAHGLPTFPFDLSVVAPHLKTLYVDGSQVAVFPRWDLQSLSLSHTFISYHNHFHLFMKTPITRLVLHRVTIPGGRPYVRRISAQHLSSITSLTLSEIQCGGSDEDSESIYALFFVLSLSRSLQELELSGLCQEAMAGLSVMLGANTTTFDELHSLTLRNVKLDALMANAIMIAFPSISSLVLDHVGGSSPLVFDFWKTRPREWPQLSEITLDSQVVKRY